MVRIFYKECFFGRLTFLISQLIQSFDLPAILDMKWLVVVWSDGVCCIQRNV
jgi:hypothetical protein